MLLLEEVVVLLITTFRPELKSCTVTGEGVDDVKLLGLRAADELVKR